MRFKVFQNFKIVVYANAINTLVQQDEQFDYENNEVLTNPKDIKFKILKEIYNGNLYPGIEYQIIGSLPVLKNTKKRDVYEYYKTAIIPMDDIAELQGDNEAEIPFLEVIE